MNAVPRIAILHQGCVPNYREAFFRRLGAVRGRDYVVFYGEPEPGSGVVAATPPYAFNSRFVRNRFMRILGRRLVYQPVFRAIAFGGYDGLVIGHEVKYFMNLALLFWFRLMGKPVLFWGFGTGQDFWDQDRGPMGRAFSRGVDAAKQLLVRSASGYLAYTDSGVATVVRAGMKRDRIRVLNNTIDLDEEIRCHAKAQSIDRAALRAAWRIAPDATVFTFVGRLLAGKKVDDLIGAVRALRDEGVNAETIIVGDGPERRALEAFADGASWCHFLGAVHDGDGIARIYRASDALVIPGYVGLAVNRGFAHGMPVITIRSDLHSPEIDYVEAGANGLILASDGFHDGLRLFAEDAGLREHLARGALVTRNKLDLGRMVAAFDDGVAAALKRPDDISLTERPA
ncbi:MAG TPA: glycosyltransferase family 4 protein [Stellaceae bacterium]|jgi:glycosyltransferase involved in cell wall biosynthesis|nr:glycosyltransferase family 4 protein [Stellaceae bacterium]